MPDGKKKNGSGGGMKRDEKGRFLPGHFGGPGRGKISKVENTKEKIKPEVIKTIKKLLASKDLKLGAKGVELFLKFFGHEKEEGGDTSILDPDLEAAYSQCFSHLQEEIIEPDFTEDTSYLDGDN